MSALGLLTKYGLSKGGGASPPPAPDGVTFIGSRGTVVVPAWNNGSVSVSEMGVQAGDLLVIVIDVFRHTFPPTVAGFTQVFWDGFSTTYGRYVGWRIADGSETSVTWTLPSNLNHAAQVRAYRPPAGESWAVNPVDVWLHNENGASSVSHAAPSVTTTTAPTLALRVWGFRANVTFTPSGVQNVATTASSAVNVTVGDEARESPGATGTRTATSSVSTPSLTTTVAFALAPP